MSFCDNLMFHEFYAVGSLHIGHTRLTFFFIPKQEEQTQNAKYFTLLNIFS